MAYYLQMDGVDDFIQMPTVTFDKVILDITLSSEQNDYRYVVDARSGTTGSYFRLAPAGSAQYVGGMSGDWSQSKLDTRTTVTLIQSPAISDDVTLFRYFATANYYAKGKVYDIKFYNGATLVAHYGMTTQTVQDQSGNGNHATLTGGTWVDDGTGGETSTPVSARFGSVQWVYAPKYYRFGAHQAIYAERTYRYKTLQEIVAGFIRVSSRFATRQVIVSPVADRFATVQRGYRPESNRAATKQRVYKAHTLRAPTRQVIRSIESVRAVTRQVVHAARTYRIPTLQTIYNPDQSIIGRISLVAMRVLRINLLGSRELIVNLQGGVTVKKEQNFEMAAGDSKLIEVAMENVDLAGATIRWAVVKSIHVANPQQLISKSTSGGITASDGIFTVTLDPEDTEDLSAGSYYHEAEITDATGNVSTVLTGKMTVLPTII